MYVDDIVVIVELSERGLLCRFPFVSALFVFWAFPRSVSILGGRLSYWSVRTLILNLVFRFFKVVCFHLSSVVLFG